MNKERGVGVEAQVHIDTKRGSEAVVSSAPRIQVRGNVDACVVQEPRDMSYMWVCSYWVEEGDQVVC